MVQGSRWFRLVVDLCVGVAMQTPKTPLKNTADELQGTLRMLQKKKNPLQDRDHTTVEPADATM
jgi:hypothetical protein